MKLDRLGPCLAETEARRASSGPAQAERRGHLKARSATVVESPRARRPDPRLLLARVHRRLPVPGGFLLVGWCLVPTILRRNEL